MSDSVTRVTTNHFEEPPSVFPGTAPPLHEHGHVDGGFFSHEHRHDGPHHHSDNENVPGRKGRQP